MILMDECGMMEDLTDRAIKYAEWASMECLDEQRVIPYGIPRQIYTAMLHQQFFPRGKGVLFPEHAEFAK